MPWAIGTISDATAAAEPPLDPLVDLAVSHGLRVGPNATGSHVGAIPNSGVFVLPTMISPARFSRRTSSGIFLGDHAAEEAGALAERDPGHFGDEVLDQERDTRQRAGGFQCRRDGERLLIHRGDHRIEGRVEPFDPVDRLGHQLGGRDLATPDEAGLRHRIQLSDLGCRVDSGHDHRSFPVGVCSYRQWREFHPRRTLGENSRTGG